MAGRVTPEKHPRYAKFRRAYADKVKLTRTRLNMDQPDFAAMLKVHRRTVQDWERGLYLPSPDKRDRIDDLYRRLENE